MTKKSKRHVKTQAAQQQKNGLKALLPCLVLAAIAFLLYANTLGHDFVLDDRMVITDNTYTRAGLAGIPGLLRNDSMRGYLQEDARYLTGGRYRPLSLILFALLDQFFGLNPLAGHLVTVMLYTLCALLLYKVLLRLFRPGSAAPWYWTVPFVATLFFILHPVHTEVVANIKSCDEILALTGALLAWYWAIQYGKESRPALAIGSGLAFFAGLMAKESAIAFAAIIPLSLWVSGQPLRRAVKSLGPLGLAAGAFIVIRFAILGFSSPQIAELLNNPFLEATTSQKWATIALTLWEYIRLLIFPHPLTYDYYPYHIPLVGWSDWRALVSVVLHIGLIAFALFYIRRRSPAAFAVSLYLIALAIVANLFFPIGTFMAERFLFVPSIGYCLLLAWAVISLQKHFPRWLAPALVILIAGLYVLKTVSRNPVWKDNFTLTTTDVRTSAKSASANTAAADWLIVRQKTTADPRLKQAMIDSAFRYLHRAIRIHPHYGRAHAIIAENYDRLKNNPDSSLFYYRRLYSIDPRWPNVAYNLGTLRLMHKPAEIDSAIYFLTKATEYFPGYGGAWKNLGTGYYYRKEYTKAAGYYLKALQIDPGDRDARNNALMAYNAAGDSTAARQLRQKYPL